MVPSSLGRPDGCATSDFPRKKATVAANGRRERRRFFPGKNNGVMRAGTTENVDFSGERPLMGAATADNDGAMSYSRCGPDPLTPICAF